MPITLSERKADIIRLLREYIDLVDSGDWKTLSTCSNMGDLPELIAILVNEELDE